MHALTQVMMLAQAGSLAQVCVTAQQLLLTHDAHVDETKSTPQASVGAAPPLLEPEPLPCPAPLLEPLPMTPMLDEHWLEHFCGTHAPMPWMQDRHSGLAWALQPFWQVASFASHLQ